MERIQLLNFLLLAHMVGNKLKIDVRTAGGLLSVAKEERNVHAINAPFGSTTIADEAINLIVLSSNCNVGPFDAFVMQALATSTNEGTTLADNRG